VSAVRLYDEHGVELMSKGQGILANMVTDPQSTDFIAQVISLIEQGESDKAVALIRSLEDKQESITALRTLVTAVVTDITHMRDRAHDLARALDLDRERARDLDLDLARAMARNLDLAQPDLDLDAALASSLALTKAMTRASERVIDLASALDRESTFALDLDLARTYVDVICRVLGTEEQPTPNADH